MLTCYRIIANSKPESFDLGSDKTGFETFSVGIEQSDGRSADWRPAKID